MFSLHRTQSVKEWKKTLHNTVICILNYNYCFLYLMTYKCGSKISLYLLSDTLCVNLFSQLQAHLPEALRPLTLPSAAHCTAIGLQHGSLLLGHQQDITEVTRPALRTGEGLQHSTSYQDPLCKISSVM